MTGAVRVRTAYKIKGVEIVLEVGQVAASDVELAAFLGCNRTSVRNKAQGNERRRAQIWTLLCLQGVSYRTCPGIAYYNISATLQCCGLSRGA